MDAANRNTRLKFLHAADIHLDSPMAGLSKRAVVPAHVTQDCTRRAFANVVDLAIAEDVAFVLIAGDLYDADWRDFSTGLFFAGEMRRLGRPCIMIRGNHDAASVITRSLVLPDNVVVLSARRAETHRLEAQGVAVHGQSFPTRAVPENLADSYPAPVTGFFNIGLLHTSAEDPGEHATYAPCSVGALVLKGYDYWALGHIHQRQVLHELPWVIFPGNIQGRNPRETGARGVTLVELEDRRIVGVSHRDVDVLRWAAAAVDLAGAESVAEIFHRVRLTLAEVFAAAEGRPLIVRLTLRGASGEHDLLDAECRNAAASVSGDLHIERVRVESAPSASGPAADAIAQLAAAFEQAAEDPSVQAQLLADFAALSGQIPRLPGRAAPDLPTSGEALRALVPEAWQAVEAMLGRA